jgi:hypothetical protein
VQSETHLLAPKIFERVAARPPPEKRAARQVATPGALPERLLPWGAGPLCCMHMHQGTVVFRLGCVFLWGGLAWVAAPPSPLSSLPPGFPGHREHVVGGGCTRWGGPTGPNGNAARRLPGRRHVQVGTKFDWVCASGFAVRQQDMKGSVFAPDLAVWQLARGQRAFVPLRCCAHASSEQRGSHLGGMMPTERTGVRPARPATSAHSLHVGPELAWEIAAFR